MFIRATSQVDKKTNRPYTTYRLVESYRNQAGQARQRTLLNLGSHFECPKDQWKILADRVEEIYHGQKNLVEFEPSLEKEAQRIAKSLTKKFSEAETALATKIANETVSDFQTVDINSLDHNDIRHIGCEHVAYHAVGQLKLEEILSSSGFNATQINIAIGSIIGRLIQPGSELATHRYLKEHSALDEILNVDFTNLNLKKFYKISDQLLKNKLKIEDALYQREKELFNLNEVVTLYDITNTYFEGRSSSNPKAHHGRSKEKRNDRPLVSLGIVLDSSGFPKKSEILAGNISEPKTLENMLSNLGSQNNATIVFDAGFATEENINWLKSQDKTYIAVSRKKNSAIPDDIEPVIVKKETNNLVTAYLVKNSETDEFELYCHSQAKENKTLQMLTKAEAKYEEELKKLKNGLTKKGCTKHYEKIIERLGRLKEKYKRVAQHYETSVKVDQENKYVIDLTWIKKEDLTNTHQAGTYCLRTNRKDLDAQTMWKIYTMLTDLEAAFRSLKSELGMRPVFHQKEKRIDGHIFISILAYHLLHTIRYQLKQCDIHQSWQTIRTLLKTHCRITSTLQIKDGRTVKIRKTSSPDVNQQLIYNALGIDTHPVKTSKTYC